jgi:hypothetical protein
MTDTASTPDALESRFRLVASVGRTYRYGKKEIELAKDLATLMPDGSQPTQKEARELLDRSKEWLKSKEKPTNKLLNDAARSMGVCPVPVKGEPGVKFTDAHIRRASTIAFYSNMPPKTPQEAHELLIMATAGVQAYARYVASWQGLPDSVRYAVIRRYNSAARTPGAVTHPQEITQWLKEEMEFKKDPFAYVFTTVGADIQYMPPSDSYGEMSFELQRMQSVAVAMRDLSSEDDFRMPPELMHLSRLEQARALYSNPAYSRLLKAVPVLPPMVVLPPDAHADAAGSQSLVGSAAQTAPLGPEDTGAHAIPLGKGRKKAGPEAPAEDAEGVELGIDVDVESLGEAEGGEDAVHKVIVILPEMSGAEKARYAALEKGRARASAKPPAEKPEFLNAKKLIGEAADAYRKARDSKLRAEEAAGILHLYPALPMLLQKSLTAVMGRDVSIEEATEIMVDGHKNDAGQATGRKGLLELYEKSLPLAVQSISLLETSVAKEKAKLEAGRTNLYAAKKADLDAWQMVKQMPSVMAEVNKRFGESNKASRTDADSAIAQMEAIDFVRANGMQVATPGQAKDLFMHTRLKRHVTNTVAHRVSERLVPEALFNDLKAAMLQDETLRARGDFASIDEEIKWHVSFFNGHGAGFPTKLVTYLLHKQGVLTPKMYDEVMRRIDAENPAIPNEEELRAFVRKSWKVFIVERVSSLHSNGFLTAKASEMALRGMLGDQTLAEKGFPTAGAELGRYVKACTDLGEPYPAHLALHLKHERGAITLEVYGAAVYRIKVEHLVFKDGTDFGEFLAKVGEHMTSDDLANARRNYRIPGIFENTGAFEAPSGSRPLVISSGAGTPPHPAPPISIPPVSPVAIGALVVPGAAGSTGPHPAADADDGGKTTTMRSPAAPPGPEAAAPAVGAPESAAAKPETVHSEAAPASAAAPQPAQAAPQPPVAAQTMAGIGPSPIHLPSKPPAVPPQDAWKTTTMAAPKLGAAAVPQPNPQEATPLETARTIILPAASVPAAAEVPPERKSTDLTPIPAEIIAASASAAPTPSEALPPSFVHDLSTPGPAAAPATEATAMEDVVEEEEAPAAAPRETILAAPSEELVAQAAEDTGGTDEAGERPTLFSVTPQELLDAAAEPAAVPPTARAPDEAGKASFEEAYVAKLSATLFSGKPLKARVGAAVMLVEEPPEVHVPILLRAYCQQTDMQPKVLSILLEKPASEVLSNAFAYRDSLAKDGVLDPALTALAERYGKAPSEPAKEDGALASSQDNPLPAMLSYVAKHRDAGTLAGADVSLVLEMARSGGISDPALVSALLPAFDRLDKGTREGIRTWITGKWNPMKKDALPSILSYMDVAPNISPESAIILAKAAREAAGDDAAPVLARLFPVMARMDQDQKTAVGLLAEKFGTRAVDYALSYAASGDMGIESAAILSRALESIGDERARGFVEHALPLFEHMNEEQQARVIGFATKYDCSDIVLMHADGLTGRLTIGQALMFAKLLLKIREGRGGTGERGKEFLAHLLPLFEHMNGEQQARATEFATKYDCSDIILKHAAGLNGKLTIGQALLLANLLLRIKESRGTDDGVAFMPYLLRFADGMGGAEKECVRGYAASFREGAEKGKDSVTSIKSFVAARGAAITEKEMALVASSLVRIHTNESFKALREIMQDEKFPEHTIVLIHNAVEAELAAEYIREDGAGESARDFVRRAALYVPGKVIAIDSIAFGVINRTEGFAAAGEGGAAVRVPARQEIITCCIDQHRSTDFDDPHSVERMSNSRDILVRFGDQAIGSLLELVATSDFSRIPEMRKTNILTTIVRISEESTSEATTQKARECLMETVKGDLPTAIVGNSLKAMKTNAIAPLRRLINEDQSESFQKRVCAILKAMGKKGHGHILEALNSIDVEERLAGATMQGLMLMHDPELADGLAADSRKPEKDRAFPTLHSVLRTLVHMLRDKEKDGAAEQVAVAAYGALSAAGSALPAEDLAKVITSGVPGGPKEALPPHQDKWSREVAANLLARAEGGESTLLAMIPDRSLAPEARPHVISASMEFGGSALPAIVEWARGGGIEEKYVALSAAQAPKSPLAELLKDIEQGVSESWAVLQQFGIMNPAEPWQQDLLRWAAVRGLVLPTDKQAPPFVAATAGKLACTLGVVSQPEFCGDLRAALDANVKRTGQLPADAEEKKMFLLEKLVENGFGIDHITGAFGAPSKFDSGKYSAFIRSMKAKQSQQPPAPAGKDGSGTRKLPK